MIFVQLGDELSPEDLSIYITDFQDYLLQETTEYYKVSSEKWSDSLSCPDFLIRAEQAVNEELGRLQGYLHSSTETPLMREVRIQILKVHQTKILESNTGIVNMLKERSTVDLARIFELYKEVEEGLEPIAAAVQKHICDLGQRFIRDSKSDQHGNKENRHTLVKNLIQLHDRFLKIMKNEFQSHREFTKAMKNSFEFFINQEYYVSNYLARYVNDFLRKGGVGVNYSEAQLEEQMVHIVMLYSYIRDKDVFENNYRGYLANRLLSDTSASEQMEKKMIGKLKQESGYHWTQKLEDMFTDIQKSKDLAKVFQRDPRGQNCHTTLNVSVCTQGAWPSTNVTTITVPEELDELVMRFTNFYQERHVGRKLNFRWDKGTAEVVVRFNDSTEKVLVVSTYQMAVLLLFNRSSGPILTYQEIMDKTGIDEKDLQVAVLSLAHPKSKILLKRPNGPKLEGNHKLRLNFKFKHPQKRIIVPMLKTVKQQQKDADETQQQVQVQRRHQVDAAIVRIMKARKQLNHPNLISDVHNQLASRFDAQPSLIKQRIQALIELEYLERDEDDRSLYMYKQ
jgi:cullin 3